MCIQLPPAILRRRAIKPPDIKRNELRRPLRIEELEMLAVPAEGVDALCLAAPELLGGGKVGDAGPDFGEGDADVFAVGE
ncbi:hypothetical protein DXG03_006531 [Asterophora parasitica]|uniref:Uncharacterized protein n=1 Tax=Asterophora parasitica TaxID=117018 RepID=A0A9P7FZ51_9AGAR|nr:hypothetical protein DXG03_006531 [Asterophora parasitica]